MSILKDPVITKTATVMHNFTVCIPKLIREPLNIKKDDKMIMTLRENGEIVLKKAPSSWSDLVGIASFDSLGGGKAFIEKERNNW